MENLTTVNKLNANDTYSPTRWVDNAQPALNADNLNKIETAIQVCRTAENNIIGEVNKTQANNETLEKNIKEVDQNYKAADADINKKIDSLTFETIYTQTGKAGDTIVFDAGEESDN